MGCWGENKERKKRAEMERGEGRGEEEEMEAKLVCVYSFNCCYSFFKNLSLLVLFPFFPSLQIVFFQNIL